MTDHEALDLERIVDRSRILVDSRNATAAVAEARGMERSSGWIVKGSESPAGAAPA